MIRLMATVLLALTLFGCGRGAETNELAKPPNKADVIADQAVPAKEKVFAVLNDPRTATFKDVHAYYLFLPSGHQVYAFCGKIHADGRPGYERFVANAGLAGLQHQIRGFGPVWKKFCTPELDAGAVKF